MVTTPWRAYDQRLVNIIYNTLNEYRSLPCGVTAVVINIPY